jgi:hypothetical protein
LGRILKTHYNSPDKASELIDGGDMSLCWTDDRWDNSGDGSYGPNYYSYRGDDCPPRHDENLNEYLANNEEYAYLFRDGEWICYDVDWDDPIKSKIVEIPSAALHV